MEGAILTGFCTAIRYQFARVAASKQRSSRRVNFAQPGDEKPVDAAPVSQVRRRYTDISFRRQAGFEIGDFGRLDRIYQQTRIAGQQCRDLAPAFRLFERTHAVDDDPARPHHRGRLVEKFPLQVGLVRDVGGGFQVRNIRMPPDRAGCRAGRIQQDRVERRRRLPCQRIGLDDRGKVKLSMRVVDQETGEELEDTRPPREPREGGDDGDSRPPRRPRRPRAAE